MQNADKSQKAIQRVKCVVDTCQYWNQGDHCYASAIEIHPPGAHDTQETDCATFQPRANT